MGSSRFVLIICLCIPVTVFGQILRVDKSHLESDSAGYTSLYTDAFYSLDNRSLSPQQKLVYVRLNSRTDLLHVSKNHAYILVNSIEYISSSSAKPFSTGYTHFRINFRRKHKVSYETFAQVQYDEIRNMRLRLLGGAGIRFTVIDENGFDVHLGTGTMIEHEKWRHVVNDVATDIYKNIPKLNNYIGIEFELSKHVKLNLWGLYQTGYDTEAKIERDRYAGEVTLNFIVSKRITWMNRFGYFYDAHPIIPINPAFYQLMNGLRMSF